MRSYKFHNPDGLYFVSFAVVYWLEVFTRDHYSNILIDCLSFCQKNKGLEITAWVIMPDHLHLVYRTANNFDPGIVLGHIKGYSNRLLIKAIQDNPSEHRKGYFLKKFKQAGRRSSNVKTYQFWRHDNHPIELWSNRSIANVVNYVHENPVNSGYVKNAEDYRYSSAIDYTDGEGLIKDIVKADLYYF